jgi:hypothetical protein
VRPKCNSEATRLTPEESIPCPNTDETSACLSVSRKMQFAASSTRCGIGRAAKITGVECAKHLIGRDTIAATPGNGTLGPKTGTIFWVRNPVRILVGFVWVCVQDVCGFLCFWLSQSGGRLWKKNRKEVPHLHATARLWLSKNIHRSKCAYCIVAVNLLKGEQRCAPLRACCVDKQWSREKTASTWCSI